MPLYDFLCPNCGKEDERFLMVSECDTLQYCSKCKNLLDKIITLGHGGIWRKGDSVPWVRSVAKFLTDGDKPNPNINTLDDLRTYYKEHPNIRPKESHPAFPSSYGDAIDAGHVNKEQQKVERSRKAFEHLRNLRRIEINSGVGQSA